VTLVDTDVLIVGAGLAGAATAFHLARTGRRRILIVEQESVPGAHSSGRNAGIVREHADHPDLAEMLKEGAARLRSGALAKFARHGVFLVGVGDEDVAAYFPRARGRGRLCSEDGTIDVAGLLRTYLTDQNVYFDTRVTTWRPSAYGVCVETTSGSISCRLVVNAAGPWAGALGNLPLTPMSRHLFVTAPLDWLDPHWPCVWDGPQRLYFRPESGGLLLCVCDETPSSPGVYNEDPARLKELFDRLSTLQPDLADLAIARTWVGQRTFAPDRSFVIGFDPRWDRLFHVAGLGGHGVTASWSIGRLAADLIEAGPHAETSAFSPQRLIPAGRDHTR